MEVLVNVLNYANDGFKVFPLQADSKSNQVLKSWKEEATTNINQIKQWFANTNYNVCIRTGDGLIVIDVDNKNGKNGNQSILPFLNKFPKTRTVRTANGGFHYYFYVDREVKCKVNLYDGIDIRGEGEYVVAPPSVIDGKAYIVEEDIPIAQANDAVYEFIKTSYRNASVELPNKSNMIPAGERNDTLFKLGCSMQAKGMSDETIRKGLEIENKTRCNPPLDEKELNTIVESVIHRYEKPISNFEVQHQVTWKSAVKMSLSAPEESTDIIEGLLPVGVTLLAAPAKMGKTFMCMQMANAIAKGDHFLGYRSKKKNVYYLAFEDTENNQIDRLQKSSYDIAEGYDIEYCRAYQTGFDLEQKIINYLHYNPNLGVVFIDTFEKIRTNTDRTYSIEYKEVTYYHELALKYHIAIVLVMHTVKRIDYNNPFANISGSAGTLAAADGLMVLLRNQVCRTIKMIHIEGKGIPADVIHTKQDSTMAFYKIEMEEDEEVVDPELSKIIHFIIDERKYVGACEKLGVEAGIENCNGRHIRSLLENNKAILKSHFIRYTVPPRTSYARKIELTFYGEDELDSDANDESDEMTQI